MPSILSPRARFLKQEGLVASYHAFSHSSEFRQALDIALLQLVHELRADEAVAPAATAHRLYGADRLAAILLTLADPPEKAPERTPIGQLNQNA